MTIKPGSREAHERSVKAAETRRRNKSQGNYRAEYYARNAPQMRDRYTPDKPRTVPVTTHVPRGGSRNVKKMTLSELTGEFERLRHTPDTPNGSVGRRYYAIKDELRNRSARERYGKTYQEIGEETLRAGKAARKAKQQRASAKKKNPAAHRKDLEGATRRLEYAYDSAKTPTAKRKIRARLTRLYKEMNTRPEYN